MKDKFYNLIIVVCICCFVFFSYKICNYLKEEKKQEHLNENIIQSSIKKSEISDDVENDYQENDEKIEIDFKALKDINKEIVAWIYSDGTPINYPIVQAKDNEYYLRRLIDGTYNQAGTLFLDCKNSNKFDDYNSIIYGHNMKNDSMFGTLTNYENQEYYNEHKEIFLFTENKKYRIELFAGFTTSSESDIYHYPMTLNTNKRLIENALNKSTFKSNVDVSSEDKIITLSTCAYNFENARYVLVGVLKEIQK